MARNCGRATPDKSMHLEHQLFKSLQVVDLEGCSQQEKRVRLSFARTPFQLMDKSNRGGITHPRASSNKHWCCYCPRCCLFWALTSTGVVIAHVAACFGHAQQKKGGSERQQQAQPREVVHQSVLLQHRSQGLGFMCKAIDESELGFGVTSSSCWVPSRHHARLSGPS